MAFLQPLPMKMLLNLKDPNNISAEGTTPVKGVSKKDDPEIYNPRKPFAPGGRKHLGQGHWHKKGFGKIGWQKVADKGFWEEIKADLPEGGLDSEAKDAFIAAKKDAWTAKFADSDQAIKDKPINKDDLEVDSNSLGITNPRNKQIANKKPTKPIKKGIIGSAEDDEITGSTRKDRIHGRAGDDTLIGGRGSDRIKGGKGDDLIDGGLGRDRLMGGKGADVFRLSQGRDVIPDFNIEQGDIIEIKAEQGYTLKQVQRGLLIQMDAFGTTTLIGIQQADVETSSAFNLG
ncbi:MAG: calcium-binding protein [Prochlorococcus sp.]